jgi:hypothetical protein
MNPRPSLPTRRLELGLFKPSAENPSAPHVFLIPVGIDEAGTGAISGPIVAAAVYLWPNFSEVDALGTATQYRLHDSKLLNATERGALFAALRSAPRLAWATGAVQAVRVDAVGVTAANAEAMDLALGRLERRLGRRWERERRSPCGALWLLVDGDNVPARFGFGFGAPTPPPTNRGPPPAPTPVVEHPSAENGASVKLHTNPHSKSL